MPPMTKTFFPTKDLERSTDMVVVAMEGERRIVHLRSGTVRGQKLEDLAQCDAASAGRTERLGREETKAMTTTGSTRYGCALEASMRIEQEEMSVVAKVWVTTECSSCYLDHGNECVVEISGDLEDIVSL